jgi:nucleoside-diphosphate-sugar epimerase
MRFDLVVNIMTAKALREGRITLMNSRHWRPLVHVRDAARTFVEVVEASKSLVSGQVFNVGSDEQNYQIWRIAETVKSVVPDAVIYDAGEGTDSRSYRVGFNKISGVLGYRTTISVGEGVRDVKRLFDEGKIEDYRKDYYYNVNYPYK